MLLQSGATVLLLCAAVQAAAMQQQQHHHRQIAHRVVVEVQLDSFRGAVHVLPVVSKARYIRGEVV